VADGLCAGAGNVVGVVLSNLVGDWRKVLIEEWQQAWNAHDTELVLSFYEELIAITSPIFQDVLGVEELSCFGKQELKQFCEKVFSAFPEYSIRVMAVTSGIGSITVHYLDSSSRLIAETMQFSHRRKITSSSALC
jgi:hypothetical protein